MFDVKSGNLDKCKSCMSVRLVKPPSLDRCCPGCFSQVFWGGHAFGFTGEVLLVRWGRSLCLTTLPFSNHWRVHLRQTFSLSLTARECSAHALLLYSCHSWSEHILETRIMGEWSYIVVQNFKAPLQVSPVTEEFASTLNGLDV